MLLELLVHIWFLESGKENGPKPKLFGPDISGWGRGLPREGPGAKKFGMSFETQGNQMFWRDIPGFCGEIPGAPEKFEKNKFVFNSRPLWKGLLFAFFHICGLRKNVKSSSLERPCFLWKYASVLDSWALKPSCNFLQFPAMCPSKTAFFSRKVHVSAGKGFFSAGKGSFLQESAFSIGNKGFYSAGKCIIHQCALRG